MDAVSRPRTALEAYAALAREKQRQRSELAAAPKDRFGRVIPDVFPSKTPEAVRALLPELDVSGSEDEPSPRANG